MRNSLSDKIIFEAFPHIKVILHQYDNLETIRDSFSGKGKSGEFVSRPVWER